MSNNLEEVISVHLGVLRGMLSTNTVNLDQIEHMVHDFFIAHSKEIIAGGEVNTTFSEALQFLTSALTLHRIKKADADTAAAVALGQLRAAEKVLSSMVAPPPPPLVLELSLDAAIERLETFQVNKMQLEEFKAVVASIRREAENLQSMQQELEDLQDGLRHDREYTLRKLDNY
jgi:FtsZ-binding cell division protein ZapB